VLFFCRASFSRNVLSSHEATLFRVCIIIIELANVDQEETSAKICAEAHDAYFPGI
jgi:hypothetical protein